MRKDKPLGAGRSSIDLVDTHKLFRVLDLKRDTAFLDLACGNGSYSIAAAGIIGHPGMIFAIDLWKEGIDSLREYVSKNNIPYIIPVLADIGKGIPLKGDRFDICLMAVVVHDFLRAGSLGMVLEETVRILHSGGRLAVIEFEKKERTPGPPVHIKLSPKELSGLITPHGFGPMQEMKIGPFTYLSLFLKES